MSFHFIGVKITPICLSYTFRAIHKGMLCYVYFTSFIVTIGSKRPTLTGNLWPPKPSLAPPMRRRNLFLSAELSKVLLSQAALRSTHQRGVGTGDFRTIGETWVGGLHEIDGRSVANDVLNMCCTCLCVCRSTNMCVYIYNTYTSIHIILWIRNIYFFYIDDIFVYLAWGRRFIRKKYLTLQNWSLNPDALMQVRLRCLIGVFECHILRCPPSQ